MAANKLLYTWDLGFKALPGVIDMLETHGTKVYEMEAADAFDGLSGYANETILTIMARAKNLGVINESMYRQFCISISKNKKETDLGVYPAKEQANRFRQLLFRVAAEEIISKSRAANLANQKLAEFRQEFVDW